MTRFKDTPTFEDLKTILTDEIAGNFISRLRDVGVPEEKLSEVAGNICYDIASAIEIIEAIGDMEIPGSETRPAAESKPKGPVAVASPNNNEEGILSPDYISKILGSGKASNG